jgi:Reverse transcriptase (RNA-dependent DNA polymerase)
MMKEIKDHQFDYGNFTVINTTEIPEGETVLPAVWQMRRKRDARMGGIEKYKARLNIDGPRMQKGKHYDKTYSPVAPWNLVRMLLTMTARHNWHTKQIDFVQAFAQAPIEKTLYMKIPEGVTLEDDTDPRDYVLKLLRNKWPEAGRESMESILGKQTCEGIGIQTTRSVRMRLLSRKDRSLAGPDKEEIDKVLEELQTKAKLAITGEGDLADFLGVNVDRRSEGTIHLTQPHLIDQILEGLRMKVDNVKSRTTPAVSYETVDSALEI